MRFLTDLSKGILGKPDSTEMWNNIISHIPADLLLDKNTNILNVSFGHGTEADAIVNRMLLLGVQPREIKSRLYLLDKYSVFTKDAMRKGYTNVIQADFLDWETDMKFDVVVGNPPYQDPDNDKKMLWNSFLDKSQKVCKADGYIAMITPATWIRAKTNIHNSYKLFEDYQVEKAVVYAKSNTPFPDVGSTISYHITKNTPRTTTTPIYYGEWSQRSETFIRNVDIKNEKVWPGELTITNLSIHDKLKKFKKIDFVKSCEFHNQKLKSKNLVSDTKDDEFCYTHYVSAAITRYTKIKFSNHSDWKVMVPLTSTIDKAVVDKDCGHGEDMLSLYVDSEKTAKNIKDLFQTEAFKFIGKMYKNGRNQVLQNIFPVVSFDKKWTSDELFDLFGFTEEEKEYARSYR
jgi:hypothetical protein